MNTTLNCPVRQIGLNCRQVSEITKIQSPSNKRASNTNTQKKLGQHEESRKLNSNTKTEEMGNRHRKRAGKQTKGERGK